MTGKWNSVTFIDVDINLAEKSPIPAAPALLESIVGVYEFDPADFPQVQEGASDSIQLYFSTKQGKLEAEWSCRNGEKENLYVFTEKAFFSVNGDCYKWKSDEMKKVEVTFYDGATVLGKRISAK